MKILNHIIIRLTSKLVGKDEFGNRYYERSDGGKTRRFVVYNGLAEPSKIPPIWHKWIHFMGNFDRKILVGKPHIPNLSGSKNAYYPQGHPLSKNRNDLTLSYQKWSPENI